jgi:hypothetical protein
MQLPEWSNGIGKHMLKIEDGKNAVGVFRGEPVKFFQHWINNRGVICTRDSGVCGPCASQSEDDRKATGRFRFNFILRDEPVAMIFEQGRKVYDQLIMINKDVPLEKVWVRISRSGTKQSTQYSIQVIPGEGGMITPAQEKKVLSVPLHDLSVKKLAVEDAAAGDDVPF